MLIKEILEIIKKEIEILNPVPKKYLRSKGSDNGFEDLFPYVANKVALSISDDVKVEPKMNHHFPDVDIILNGIKYGVELKSRNNGTWTTNGNSVLESITDEGYEEIFLFFASKVIGEDRLMVRFQPYWETTKSIRVTHSPRFIIDITKDNNESVFKNKEEYDLLRSSTEQDKVEFIQSYLSENTNGTKWYTRTNENVKPIEFKSLSKEERNVKLAELFFLYPGDLIGTSNKYTRSASYLLEHHYIFSHALRDSFSASGMYEYKGERIPRVYEKLRSLNSLIKKIAEESSEDFKKLVIKTWKDDHFIMDSSGNLIEDYKNIIDSQLSISSRNNMKKTLENIGVKRLSDFIFQ